MQSSHWARRHLPEILLLGAAAALFLADLGGDAMRDWDEATYAAVAREMARGGTWLTPHLDGRLFADKPPLVLWLIAAAYRLLGASELAARLPAALLGIGGVGAAYLLARRLGGRGAGLLAGVILATAPQWLRFSRQAMLDVPLAACLAFSVVGALAGSWVLLGSALGAALMVKGPAALVIAPALLAWTLLDRRQLVVGLRGAALAGALAAPWHVWQLAAHGWEFGRVYLGLNVVARMSAVVEGNTGPWWYYLEYVFFHWVNPWHWLGAAAVVAATVEAVRGPRRSPARVLLLAWFWTTLAFFSAVPTKLHWYVMPAYPALSVITACWLTAAARPRRWLRPVIGGLCAVTLAAAGADVVLRRLGSRPAEDTRAVLRALPSPALAPVLLLADDIPLGAARFYARRELRRWTSAQAQAADAWLLATPAVPPAGVGLRLHAAHGSRTLFGPR